MINEAPPSTAAEEATLPSALPEEERQAVAVELVIDSHRVVGEIRHPGAPRRLVDILNSIESSGSITLHDGRLDDPFCADEPRSFDIVQVRREAVLFAAPRGGPSGQRSELEAVTKVAVPATIVLPGFEISGNVFLLPDADPGRVPLLNNRHFMPLTDATIAAAQGRSLTWREPLLIVNLARALLYAPNGTEG